MQTEIRVFKKNKNNLPHLVLNHQESYQKGDPLDHSATTMVAENVKVETSYPSPEGGDLKGSSPGQGIFFCRVFKKYRVIFLYRLVFFSKPSKNISLTWE